MYIICVVKSAVRCLSISLVHARKIKMPISTRCKLIQKISEIKILVDLTLGSQINWNSIYTAESWCGFSKANFVAICSTISYTCVKNGWFHFNLLQDEQKACEVHTQATLRDPPFPSQGTLRRMRSCLIAKLVIKSQRNLSKTLQIAPESQNYFTRRFNAPKNGGNSRPS